jgi:hypothetical protein
MTTLEANIAGAARASTVVAARFGANQGAMDHTGSTNAR